MAKQSDFDKFLSNIEPSQSTVSYISSVQNTLRDYLKNHKVYADIYADSFLSGSYAKHTSIRPAKDDKKRDVDIIIVTNHCLSDDSLSVLSELFEVLQESSTYSSAELQHHSIGIELSQVSVDVVPVIQDDEDESLYYVCDSETGEWIKTDPKGHKTWSTQVNQDNHNKYKPLVKIFKWWRRVNCPSDVRYPKGITLEKLIADNIGDSERSTEDLVISTMQNMISAYKGEFFDKGMVPYLADPSEKVSDNDLLAGYSADDFAQFLTKLTEHADLLNSRGTANDVWREILGKEFPQDSSTKSSYALVVCATANHRQKPIWPMSHGGAAFIGLRVQDENGNLIEYESNGAPLDKGLSLHFQAYTGVKRPFIVKWQITNTGEEARRAGCLRGNFENSDIGEMGKRESTSYSGSHSVQCFIIKKGICVAKSRDFIINIK